MRPPHILTCVNSACIPSSWATVAAKRLQFGGCSGRKENPVQNYVRNEVTGQGSGNEFRVRWRQLGTWEVALIQNFWISVFVLFVFVNLLLLSCSWLSSWSCETCCYPVWWYYLVLGYLCEVFDVLSIWSWQNVCVCVRIPCFLP